MGDGGGDGGEKGVIFGKGGLRVGEKEEEGTKHGQGASSIFLAVLIPCLKEGGGKGGREKQRYLPS